MDDKVQNEYMNIITSLTDIAQKLYDTDNDDMIELGDRVSNVSSMVSWLMSSDPRT